MASRSEELATVEGDDQLKSEFTQSAGSCTFYLGFNNATAPFDNKEVRQAFAQAIDREAYTRDLEEGLALPTQSFIPKGIPGYDPTETLWAFDAEAAKAKLDAAGFDKQPGNQVFLQRELLRAAPVQNTWRQCCRTTWA